MEKQLSIAVMLPRFSHYGGVEGIAYRFAQELAKKGYQVDFICARAEVPAPDGVRVLDVGRIGGIKFLKMLWYLIKAESIRKKNDYDCTVSFGKTWNQDITRVGGGPLRVFWRLSIEAWNPGLPRLCKKISRILQPANWLTLLIEKRMFSQTPHIIAISKKVKSWLEEAYPHLKDSKNNKTQIVYNCPDTSRFFIPNQEQREQARKQFCIGNSEIALGVATTNFALKGVAPLIKALSILPEKYHLHVAGGRNPEKYQAIAKDIGVEGRVHFHGKIQDMQSFYHALDMFVLPTFYDTLANVVLEALSSGVKTLCSDRAGASEFLPEDQILTEPGNPDALAKSILALQEKEEKVGFVAKGDGIEELIDIVEKFLTKN